MSIPKQEPPLVGVDAVRAPSTSGSNPDMVEWILEAGLRILEAEGPPGLTVQHLAERAGVAVGSLYRHFKNKEDIIEAVYRRQLDQELSAMEEGQDAIASLPIEDSVRLSMEHAVARHRRLHRLHPKFYEDNAARLSISTYNPDASNRARAMIEQSIRNHLDEVRSDLDVDMACFMILEGVNAILRSAVESRHDILEHPEFADELVRLFTGYLTSRPVE
ncbi:MAG: TetR/AcrR family transcriptional regulator [Myxococcota bacterium]|nr:TetR/AcrR family transcriptional regulator [Myxococcota bacterium]